MNISFRKYDFKIHRQDDQIFIFDEVRKKNVILTPEEWVRQNFIHYLIEDLRYPRSKIAVEKEFNLNGLKKRFDLLVFDRATKPFLLIECKAQSEALNEKVLKQCLDYNLKFGVPFFCISNGDFTHAWHVLSGKVSILKAFPAYIDKE